MGEGLAGRLSSVIGAGARGGRGFGAVELSREKRVGGEGARVTVTVRLDRSWVVVSVAAMMSVGDEMEAFSLVFREVGVTTGLERLPRRTWS